MSRSLKEKVRISWRLLRRSPLGPGSIGSRLPASGSGRRRLDPPGPPVDPRIAPPGVAYVEHTPTGPTFSVTRVGGASAGTETHPVSRVWEKCSTIPVVDAASVRDAPGRSRPAIPRNLRNLRTRVIRSAFSPTGRPPARP
ncbi:hypothetical protein GCM10023350_00490 [Nocardioides endophyticus]|uniref:Uncharacterized protein n=1 Tax=Nocardioides endophyticus TaxID=1353775 RepID=A0ABP8Y5H4_9ACTN